MLRPIDEYFLSQPEPSKSCLLYLRDFLINFHPDITEEWKYKLPFYYFKGKMFCYLWTHKKYKQPYIGIMEGRKINHPDLLQEDRSQVKILLVNPEATLPIKKINSILKEALSFY